MKSACLFLALAGNCFVHLAHSAPHKLHQHVDVSDPELGDEFEGDMIGYIVIPVGSLLLLQNEAEAKSL